MEFLNSLSTSIFGGESKTNSNPAANDAQVLRHPEKEIRSVTFWCDVTRAMPQKGDPENTFETILPRGSKSGDVMIATTPCGQKVKLAIPPRGVAGATLTFSAPTLDAQLDARQKLELTPLFDVSVAPSLCSIESSDYQKIFDKISINRIITMTMFAKDSADTARERTLCSILYPHFASAADNPVLVSFPVIILSNLFAEEVKKEVRFFFSFSFFISFFLCTIYKLLLNNMMLIILILFFD